MEYKGMVISIDSHLVLQCNATDCFSQRFRMVKDGSIECAECSINTGKRWKAETTIELIESGKGWFTGKRKGKHIGEFHLQSDNTWKWYNFLTQKRFDGDFLVDVAAVIERLNSISAMDAKDLFGVE
jgi:hypothetical protein